MTKVLSAEELLEYHEHSISTLEEYTKTIGMVGGKDEILLRSMFLGFSAESIGADRATFYVCDREEKLLFPNATMRYEKRKLVPRDYYAELKDVSIKANDDLCGYVTTTREAILIDNAPDNDLYKGLVDRAVGMEAGSVIDMPLVAEGEVIGVLEVANRLDSRTLGPRDLSVVSVIANVTMLIMEKMKLYGWAITDNLTQLFNYHYLEVCMARELTRGNRYPQDIALILVDIDDFKVVNDSHGHLCGNRVLKGVAKIIDDTTRDQIDIPVRFGGDEFLILLPETDLAGAQNVAERIVGAVREGKFRDDGGKPVKVTVSAGITTGKKGEALDKPSLMKKADKALYLAKTKGKDRLMLVQ